MELTLAHLRRAQSLAAGLEAVEMEVSPLVRQARHDFTAFCEHLGKPNADHHSLWVHEFVPGVDLWGE